MALLHQRHDRLRGFHGRMTPQAFIAKGIT